MAQAICPTEGRVAQWNSLVANAATQWNIGLFLTPYVPALSDTLTTVSPGNEATFPGYAQQNPVPTPLPPAVDANNNAQITFATLTWTCTIAPGTPQQVTGWFIWDNVTGLLLYECTLDNPVTITNAGDSVGANINGFLGQLTPPF